MLVAHTTLFEISCHGLPDFYIILGKPARNKLTMMVFRKSKLFEMASSSADGRALNMDKSDISKLNSYVISASIAGKHLTGLKEKVRTIFKPIKVRLSYITNYC